MRVQRIRSINNETSWTVIGDDYIPVQPIQKYLQYCQALEYSPNTIEAYARHLKLYWEYLTCNKLDWTTIQIDKLSNFIVWLRQADPRVLTLQPQPSGRNERTINTILSAVYSFYNFHIRCDEVGSKQLYTLSPSYTRDFKPFLHHISKKDLVKKKLIKLKEPKKAIQTLSKEEVKALIDACNNLRDKFLINLLYETGMRIGQVLGLRHEDIKPWDNQIHVVPRNDNANQARAKRRQPFKVDVSIDLMALYSDYFSYEYPQDLITDYVFVNIWEGRVGHPINYSTVSDLFKRLRAKTGIQAAHPHIFRHTHATNLIEAGMSAEIVRERLGHASIQTTINTYVHIRPKALKKAYQEYLEAREN